jgi:hypothetical protein
MGKMFYSLDEAARRLGKTPDEVQELAARGQLDERIINDKPVYKREQVDLIAGDDDGAGIPLADSGAADSITLADSDAPGGRGESTKEKSGISIFEADDLDDSVDASAQTQVTGSIGGAKIAGDPGASGSGLLDLTRDSKDDTGVGPSILQDIGYKDDKEGTGEAPAMSGGGGGGGGRARGGEDRSALFENAGVASDVGGAMAAPVYAMPELPIDRFSGVAAGLAVGMSIAALVGVAVLLTAMTGASGGLLGMVSGNHMAVIGALAGVTVIGAIAGFVLGPKK